jgi:hypothetical protein
VDQTQHNSFHKPACTGFLDSDALVACLPLLLLPLLLQGARIPPLPVVIGESGAKDWGDNSRNNTDTTLYTEADKLWLNIVASYLRALSEKTGQQPSWFWWAWNANSGAGFSVKAVYQPATS